MDASWIEKVEQESVESIVLGKVFHVYQQRNERVNWGGDTDMVKRGTRFRLSLDDATGYAEKSRKQGTKFVIDELPAICIRSKSGLLAITELHSGKPPIF